MTLDEFWKVLQKALLERLHAIDAEFSVSYGVFSLTVIHKGRLYASIVYDYTLIDEGEYPFVFDTEGCSAESIKIIENTFKELVPRYEEREDA